MIDMARYMANRRKRRREELIRILGSSCQYCGTSEDLEFDHVDPQTKNFTVGTSLDRPWHLLIEEAKLCQLLCPSCHVKKSRENLDGNRVNHGEGITGKNRCYCELCAPLKRLYAKRFKHTKNPRSEDPPPHGQRRRYIRGCRCDDCKLANTNYARERRKRISENS